MATRSLKMETQAGRLHSDHTQPQLMFRKFRSVKKSKCVKPVRSWRAAAAPKAEFNQKTMLNKVNIPHLYL